MGGEGEGLVAVEGCRRETRTRWTPLSTSHCHHLQPAWSVPWLEERQHYPDHAWRDGVVSGCNGVGPGRMKEETTSLVYPSRAINTAPITINHIATLIFFLFPLPSHELERRRFHGKESSPLEAIRELG